MKILALNSGSSSVKYRLFDSDQNYKLLQWGLAERIGQEGSSVSHFQENRPVQKVGIPLPDHHTAIQALFNNHSIILETVDAVGHRVVHGGELFRKPVFINKEVLNEIAAMAKFAPLHCYPNVLGIEILQSLLPKIPQVAVFDTAAHAAMSPKAYLYGLPIKYYEEHKIRKYGFHGINHNYVAHEAARLLEKKIEDLKIITCHLGNGCSITAFENGKSIDNSMGLTPLEGLVMGTRCGDIDPSVVLYLIEELKMSPSQVSDLLNKESGLLGLCGKSDMRDIIAMAKDGDRTSQIAIDVFVYRIQKYIGVYIMALNGADALVFTGGIGENSPYIRELIVKNLSFLGVTIDSEQNKKNSTLFSANNSKPLLMVIAANEEVEIAKQTHRILS